MKILMPQLGETVSEGSIAIWYKQVGDSVKKDEALLDVETDKATLEIPAPVSGVISEINVSVGEIVDVGVVLAVISGDDEEPAEEASDASTAPQETNEPAPVSVASSSTAVTTSAAVNDEAQTGFDNSAMLSPAVRRLVAEHKLDVSEINGTGKNGRITRDDVLAYLDNSSPAAPTQLSDTLIPFDRFRKLTADHMVMSKATSPHVLQAVEVDYHAVEAVRQNVGPAWRTEHGYSLSYLPFIAKAIVMAITEFPRINASIVGDALQLHASINLAIAVDMNFEGLVAPVIKNSQTKSVTEIAVEIKTLSTKARSKSLSPDDFADGTYTISNSGPFGTLLTAPIINQPQVAIISTDGIRKKPVVIEGKAGDSIAIRPVGILAQSFDHRAFDGAYSAAFLNRLREILEQHNWEKEI